MLPSVAAGASFNWQCPASLVGFDPILLSCAKKNGVDRQEEVAQRNPLEGVPLDASRNRWTVVPLAPRGYPVQRFSQSGNVTYF